ncbi:MAG TPA: AMP-binding protein [Terriglobia bacterium]|nr:AMP-binding protein [Terriglobia bacterium]
MEPSPPSSEQSRTEARVLELTRQLLTELGSHRGLKSLDLRASLERDLGLGSLERVELLSRLEKDYKLRLPDNLFSSAETVSDLAIAINSRQHTDRAGSFAGTTTYSQARNDWKAPYPTLASSQASRGFFSGSALPETLVQAVMTYARNEPDRLHIHLLQGDQHSRSITYEDLSNKSLSVASGILNRGIARGERVSLMLPTCDEFFFSFLGILMAGCVPVPIYPPFRPDRIEEYAHRQALILRNAQVRLLITFQEAHLLAKLLRPKIPSLEGVVTIDGLNSNGQKPATETIQPDDIALIQYTSGSTGDPKGVVLSHANLVANIRSIAQAIQLQPADSGVSWLPLYHDMGLIGCWLSCLYYGIPLTLMSPLDFLSQPERWLWAIHYARATLSAAPNFAYELAINKIPSESLSGLDLSSWRAALNGAEPVSPHTLKKFSERFRKYGFREEALLPVYGLAECAVALSVPPLGRAPRIDEVDRELFARKGTAVPSHDAGGNPLYFVSVGKPIPGHEIRIVDGSGQTIPERTQGHIQFRGPSVMQGYFGNPSATQEVSHDGWIDSGDLGYQAEGELYVTGRSKDIIIKGGRNLYPQEIEEVVGGVSGIRQGCVAAFGISNLNTGTERFIIVAETRINDESELESLKSKIVNRVIDCLGLPPDIVVTVPPHAVPKTSSGKIRRDACRRLFQEGKLVQSRRPTWLQVVTIALGSVGGYVRRGFHWLCRTLYGFYTWWILGIIGVPCWLILWFVPASDSGLSRRIYRFLCRCTFSFIGMNPLLEGQDHLARAASLASQGKPLLLVSNHSSYADALVLGAALALDFRFLVKSEVASWPVLGRFVRKCDFLLVHRYDASQLSPDFQKVHSGLKEGAVVHIFPEGTFTRARGLRPFQMGAFKLAVETNSYLLPVTLCHLRQVLPEGAWLPRWHPIRVVVGPLLIPQSGELAEQVRLRNAVQKEFLRHCGEGALDLILAGPPRE